MQIVICMIFDKSQLVCYIYSKFQIKPGIFSILQTKKNRSIENSQTKKG